MSATFGWYRPWFTDVLNSSLSSKAKLVAGVLASQEGKPQRDGSRWPDGRVRHSLGILAQLSSLDPKTVWTALNELETAGLIARGARSRTYVEIELVARSGTTPDQETVSDRAPRPIPSRSGTTPDQNGNHARSRLGTTPDTSTTSASPSSDVALERGPGMGGLGGRVEDDGWRVARLLHEIDPEMPTAARHAIVRDYDGEPDVDALRAFIGERQQRINDQERDEVPA